MGLTKAKARQTGYTEACRVTATNITIPMSKNFFQDGKWIDKPTAVAVVVCACGSKYIKTRDEQGVCLRCLAKQKAKTSVSAVKRF